MPRAAPSAARAAMQRVDFGASELANFEAAASYKLQVESYKLQVASYNLEALISPAEQHT